MSQQHDSMPILFSRDYPPCPARKIPRNSNNKSLLTTLFRKRWLNIGLALFCGLMNLGSVHKHASWPHALSITYMYLARSGSQSQPRIWFILPALGAGHIMKTQLCSFRATKAHQAPPATPQTYSWSHEKHHNHTNSGLCIYREQRAETGWSTTVCDSRVPISNKVLPSYDKNEIYEMVQCNSL